MQKQSVVVALVLSVAMLVGCATQSQLPGQSVKPSAKPAAAKRVAKPAEATAKRVNEFEQMISLLNLQGEQLAAFKQKCAAREQALAAWLDGTDGKKLVDLRQQEAAAKAEGKTNQVQKVQQQAAPLSAAESALKKTQRAAVMSTLSLPQQQQWAGSVLFGKVNKTFRKANLTEQQIEKMKAVCDKQAAGFVKADTIATDPYLVSLNDIVAATVQAVTDSVLTAEQKAALPVAAAPATKK